MGHTNTIRQLAILITMGLSHQTESVRHWKFDQPLHEEAGNGTYDKQSFHIFHRKRMGVEKSV